jgi:hypothetical protein
MSIVCVIVPPRNNCLILGYTLLDFRISNVVGPVRGRVKRQKVALNL